MKEAKQWVGVSWTEPFFWTRSFGGGMRGGGRRGFVFPSFPRGVDTMQLSSSGEAVGSLFSPWQRNQSHPRDHMVRFIPSCVHPIFYLLGHQPVICASRGSTCYYYTRYIHRTHHWRGACWKCENGPAFMQAAERQLNFLRRVLVHMYVCVCVCACSYLTQQLWKYREVIGKREPGEFCCGTVIELNCSCQHVCQSWWVPLVLAS